MKKDSKIPFLNQAARRPFFFTGASKPNMSGFFLTFLQTFMKFNLNRTDLAHVITEQKGVTGNPQMDNSDFNTDETNVYQPAGNSRNNISGSSSRKQLSVDLSMGVQSDAPLCNVCGHTTLRSGACYKWLNI